MYLLRIIILFIKIMNILTNLRIHIVIYSSYYILGSTILFIFSVVLVIRRNVNDDIMYIVDMCEG